MGGSGKQKALALIGDRLLDLKLYESLVLNGEEREGWMTQKRSMLVSNENLARCGSDLLVPSVLNRKEFNLLSTHEKGTLVEAYLGVLYIQEETQITSRLNEIIHSMIKTLQSYLNTSEDSSPTNESSLLTKSQYKPPADRKKAKSTLLEVLQKRGVNKASNFFTTWSIETPNFPPFVSKFEPNFDLISCNLPDPGPVIGEICSSKKDAEESVASKVLQFFRDRELMVFAPEKSELLSSQSTTPASLPEQVEEVAKKYTTYEGNIPSPIYGALEVDNVKINVVTGGRIDEILQKSHEDYLRTLRYYGIESPVVELPESATLPDSYRVPQKRLLDPSQWQLCTAELAVPATSTSGITPQTSTVTIFDSPYVKKYRQSESNGETEEGEVVMDEMEIQEVITKEREEENKRVRENLIAVRKARVLAEQKKIANFKKYASRKRE